MVGVIRRRAKVVGHKIAAGAKMVGFWAKRGAQVATGAQLSARMMEKVPAANSVGIAVRRTTQGAFTRTSTPGAAIEVNRRGKRTIYDEKGKRVSSTVVKGGDRVVVEKNYRPGNLLPTRVEKRFQKR